MDKIIEDIIHLFDEIEYPVSIILKTPNAGDEVDNGYGVEFELSPYAVIHKDNLMFDDVVWSKVCKWRRENVDLLMFDEKCLNDELIQNLNEMDGYEVVWRRV
jgi:hypothetical protein